MNKKYVIWYQDDYNRIDRIAFIDDPKNHPYTSLEYYTVYGIWELGNKVK
jgi:hypothetical protein